MQSDDGTGLPRRPPPGGVIGGGSLRFLRSLVVALVAMLTTTLAVGGQLTGVSEYEVKAVYILNFARFVNWPAGAFGAKGEPFTICVLGKDPFGPALNGAVSGETISGHSVVTKRIASPQDAADCQILFISSSEENRLTTILAGLNKTPLLTVSDIPGFSQHDGMIEFVLQANKVRFEVNLAAAQQAGLTLSSELLKVATTVRRDPQPGD